MTMTLINTSTISRSTSMESINSSLFDFIDDDRSISNSTASAKDVEVSFDISNFDDDDLVSLHSKNSVDQWLALAASPVPNKTRPPMTSPPPVTMINMSIVVSDSEECSSSEQSSVDDEEGYGLGFAPLDDDDDFITDGEYSPFTGGATVVSQSDSESAHSSEESVGEASTPFLSNVTPIVATVQTLAAPLPAPTMKAQQQQVIQDWNDLRVVDLKEELKRRGLKRTGRKAVLVERLIQDDRERTALRLVANQDDDEYGESSAEPTPDETIDSDVGNFDDIFSNRAEKEMLAQFSSDGVCEAISDTELMTMMTTDIIDTPVEALSKEEISRPPSTEGEDAIARVLHYLRFYQPNKTLFKEAHETVMACFEKGVATNSLKDVPGIVFERFVEIMGHDFIHIFQASAHFDKATVLRAQWY